MGEATERVPVAGPAGLSKDFRPRLLSALVMGAVAIVCTWFGAVSFALLVLVVGLAMSWEWSRIVRGTGSDGAFAAHALTVALAIGLTGMGMTKAALIAVAAGCIATLALSQGRRPLFSALGVAYVALPSLSLVMLRGTDAFGALAILFIFAVVWTCDTFAYICGRLIGGPRLWPALSPGKTWSGTLSGLLFAAIAGLLFAAAVAPKAPIALAGVAILLAIVSQIGDLAESAFKRAFSVKDASDLIPGHGGFMDRMDGVVTAAVVAALIAAARGNQAPAQALLLWS